MGGETLHNRETWTSCYGGGLWLLEGHGPERALTRRLKNTKRSGGVNSAVPVGVSTPGGWSVCVEGHLQSFVRTIQQRWGDWFALHVANQHDHICSCFFLLYCSVHRSLTSQSSNQFQEKSNDDQDMVKTRNPNLRNPGRSPEARPLCVSHFLSFATNLLSTDTQPAGLHSASSVKRRHPRCLSGPSIQVIGNSEILGRPQAADLAAPQVVLT